MSAPETKVSLSSVVMEFHHGISSLHMPPDPINPPDEDESPFLSDMDGNAKHSIEHLHSGLHILNEVVHKLRVLANDVLFGRIAQEETYDELMKLVRGE